MASRKDSEKIRLIELLKNRSKRTGANLYSLLAKNDFMYEKAIASQRRAAIWTLICCILGLIVTIALNVWSKITYGTDVDIVSYILIFGLLSGIVVLVTYKTIFLTTTPTVILVMTIFQLILSVLFFTGIIPLIALVFNIIALVRWSTYRNWYDEISIAFYKGEKRVKEKSHKTKKLKDVYDFSNYDDELENEYKKPVGLIVALIFTIILGIGGCIGCYCWGRNGGWIDGYAAGKNDGLNEGHDAGYGEGYNVGRSSGYTWNDLQNRYNDGYNDGYRKAGCVIYGVNCN